MRREKRRAEAEQSYFAERDRLRAKRRKQAALLPAVSSSYHGDKPDGFLRGERGDRQAKLEGAR